MKKLIHTAALSLAILAAPLTLAGSLGSPRQVSDINVGSQFPEIAYVNGTIHVVWTGFAAGKLGDIFYSRATSASGNNFTVPVNLSGTATASSGNDQAQVVATAGGVVIVGYHSHDDQGALYVRRSTDGGASFAAAQLIAGVEGDPYYTRITDLFVDSGGRIHVAYYTNADTSGSSGMIHHRMSCDGGASWSTDTAVTHQTLDGDVDNEQPRLGEAGGRMYIAYRSTRHGDPQGGWAPSSINTKSGTVSGCAVAWSFPARRLAGGTPFTLSSTYRPDLFGDSTGAMHLMYWDNTFGANSVYRKLLNGTSAFGNPAQMSNYGVNHLEPGGLTNTGGYQVPPAIVTNGTVAFMAYGNHTATTNNHEHGTVSIRESADNGANWSNEVTAATAGSGARMAIDTANNQNVGVVFTDLSNPTVARIVYRLYTLGAIGGGANLDVPTPPSFGNQPVGTPSANTVITVQNTGAAGSISAVNITGLHAPDFQPIVANTCNGAIGAGATCQITVRMNAQAVGTRTATLIVTSNADNSPTSVTLTGTGVASGDLSRNVSAVITGYYENILQRTPDTPGKNFWSSEVSRVAGLGASAKEVFFAMSLQFFNSAEYTSRNTTDTQYITDMYRTFFIREPDGPGLAFWQNYLNQGVDRGALLTNFLFSTEFSNFMTTMVGNPTVRPEIDMTIDLYRGILGVLPDSGGFNFWLGQIRAAQCSGAAAVTAKVGELAGLFVGSAEYQNREAARLPGDRNRMHVGDLYNAFLRRGAEPTGYNFWVSQINSGAQTRDQVRAQFLTSTEFQARVNAVIAAGCAP